MGSSTQTNKESASSEEQEQVVVARVLSNFRPKDENKPVKQRVQNQARRRVVSVFKDNSSSSSPHNILQYQQWRSMDLLSDVFSIYPTQKQSQQQSCFSNLLPPLTASKILPPTSGENKPSLHSFNKPIMPVQVRSRSQVKMQEIPPPLEEHQKDEEEWLNGKSVVTEKLNEDCDNSSCLFRQKPTYQLPFPLPQAGKLNTPMSDYCSQQQTQIRTRPFRPLSSPVTAARTGTMSPASIPLPKI